MFERALKAGAKSLRPVADQFYGDRMGTLEDPFGHVWTIGTHVEDVSPEEMKRRMAAAPPLTRGGKLAELPRRPLGPLRSPAFPLHHEEKPAHGR